MCGHRLFWNSWKYGKTFSWKFITDLRAWDLYQRKGCLLYTSRIMRLESQELEEHLHRQIVNIQDINESNVRVKEVMEQQLIDHKDSIGKIYSITAGLEQRMPDEVIFYAVEMLGKLMKTKDVDVYKRQK